MENLVSQKNEQIINKVTENVTESKRLSKFENVKSNFSIFFKFPLKNENNTNSEKKVVLEKENNGGQVKLLRKKTPKSHSLECVKNYTYEHNSLAFSEFSPFIYNNRFRKPFLIKYINKMMKNKKKNSHG